MGGECWEGSKGREVIRGERWEESDGWEVMGEE